MSTTHDPTPVPGGRRHLTVVPSTGPALDPAVIAGSGEEVAMGSAAASISS